MWQTGQRWFTLRRASVLQAPSVCLLMRFSSLSSGCESFVFLSFIFPPFVLTHSFGPDPNTLDVRGLGNSKNNHH